MTRIREEEVGVQSDVPLPLHMHTAMFATINGFIDGALRNTVPSVSEPLLQLVNCRVSVFLSDSQLTMLKVFKLA